MHDTSLPVLAVGGLAFLLGLAAYIACFVFAATTGKLSVGDYIIGSLGMMCGIGFFYFIFRANTVTLAHSFDLINAGGDPAASRRLNQRFKYAAGTAMVMWIVGYIVTRMA
jgi:hypothetical protein